MHILTCNIRCPSLADGPDHWPFRKAICADVIAAQSPDIICFQEMWDVQLRDLQSEFPAYEWFATVDEPSGQNPMNAVFYRAAAFTRISGAGYWLSETPHVPGSKSWDSDCVRLANWLRLRARASGKEFRVINAHLDHVSQTARENQARLIVEDSNGYPADYAQVLTGDMNCAAGNPAIALFEAGMWRDTYTVVHGVADPGFTNHGFLGPDFRPDAGRPELGKIDWIFVKGNLRVADASIIKDARDGRFPSDHYFVSAEVHLV
jgi:endonuclease/exonuclease/phosphatase family metal-dependent hydrolase